MAEAVILATPWIDDIRSWCEDCCVGDWNIFPADLSPAVINGNSLLMWQANFSSHLDCKMFCKIYHQEMKLALESTCA